MVIIPVTNTYLNLGVGLMRQSGFDELKQPVIEAQGPCWGFSGGINFNRMVM